MVIATRILGLTTGNARLRERHAGHLIIAITSPGWTYQRSNKNFTASFYDQVGSEQLKKITFTATKTSESLFLTNKISSKGEAEMSSFV